ncbi:MAG: M48 family metalloprotease [Mycobacterium leprae]
MRPPAGAPAARSLRWIWLLISLFTAAVLFLPVLAHWLEGPLRPDVLQYLPAQTAERGRSLARDILTANALGSMVTFGAMLWLCLSQSGNRVVVWLEGLGRGRLWLSTVILAFVAALSQWLPGLPFAFYGYRVKVAYGLVHSTPLAWLIDTLVSFIIDAILISAIAIPCYALLRRSPRWWWLPGGAIAVVLFAFMNMIYPVYIQPLTTPVVPVTDPQVLSSVERLADKGGVKIGPPRELLMSQKTKASNASVSGLGPTKQVLIWDTLLQQLQPKEVEVVLGHELGHARYMDEIRYTVEDGLIMFLIVYLLAWILRLMARTGAMGLSTPFAPRVFMPMLALALMLQGIASPIENTISRVAESRADRFALELTADPASFISAFKKMSSENLSDIDPPKLDEWLRWNHPSIMNRFRQAEAFAREQGH